MISYRESCYFFFHILHNGHQKGRLMLFFKDKMLVCVE